ncbi:MAG: membrane protein insertion efficiency factor YidD [Tatlockia sp.]|nr:membrane protein insertion efficiency factor YidD [Tatlockia sp.]
MEQVSRFIRRLMCLPIVLYQVLLSPILTPSCRFYPSCSNYALTAIKDLGVLRGVWLAMRRLLRCNPWAKGGYDPVSPNKENH